MINITGIKKNTKGDIPANLPTPFCYLCSTMNEHLDPTSEGFSQEELDIERALRPISFDDFTGQQSVLENLKIFVQAANLRKEALDHTLYPVPRDWGKPRWRISWPTSSG